MQLPALWIAALLAVPCLGAARDVLAKNEQGLQANSSTGLVEIMRSSTCPIFCQREGDLFCKGKTFPSWQAWLVRHHGPDWKTKLAISENADFAFFDAARSTDTERDRDHWCASAGCVMFQLECASQTKMVVQDHLYGSTQPLSSPQGKAFIIGLKEKVQLSGFLRMGRFFTPQSYVTYSAVASLTTALNSLVIEPMESMHMNSFWDEDSVLRLFDRKVRAIVEEPPFGTPMEEVLKMIRQIAKSTTPTGKPCLDLKGCLAKSDECGPEHLAKDLYKAAMDPKRYLVLGNYVRGVLQQAGGPHWSPLYGTNCDGEEALTDDCKTIIFDTARFLFEPQLVSIKYLHRAMAVKTDESELPSHGWILLKKICHPWMQT